MSIIQEALKKSDKVSHKQDVAARKSNIKIPPQPAQPVQRSGKVRGLDRSKATKAALILSVIITTALVLRLLVITFAFPKNTPVKTPAAPEAAPLKPVVEEQPAVKAEERPIAVPVKPATPKPPAFILNGIMYLDGRAQAIINGYILEVGDSLNGATIMLIERDYVLLNMNDAKVKLRLVK